jgi:hypothetical protein
MEILVLGNAGEIMERIASKRADTTSIVFSKCRQNGNIESSFERARGEVPATVDLAKASAAALIGTCAPPQSSIVGEGPKVSHDARKGESGGMIT